MSEDYVTFPIEEFRLLVELAGVSRNPRTGPRAIAPFIGGSARAMAARRAHDQAKNVLREEGAEPRHTPGINREPIEDWVWERKGLFVGSQYESLDAIVDEIIAAIEEANDGGA